MKPHGSRRLEFHYTGLSLVAPEKVQFKYRLEGLEKDWVDAGPKRVANYSFVPPGNYNFHMIACNNDGIWNEAGVMLPFTLLPHFWQTWWFHFMGGLVTMAVACFTQLPSRLPGGEPKRIFTNRIVRDGGVSVLYDMTVLPGLLI